MKDTWFLTKKMKTFTLIVCLVTIMFQIVSVHSKTCKEFIKDASDKQVKSFFECRKQLNYPTVEERIQKMTCILKCAMTKEGFLSPDGYVDEASAIAYLEKEIPAENQGRALQLMAPCQQMVGDVDPEESTCVSYKPLIKCAMMVLFKVCNDN